MPSTYLDVPSLARNIWLSVFFCQFSGNHHSRCNLPKRHQTPEFRTTVFCLLSNRHVHPCNVFIHAHHLCPCLAQWKQSLHPRDDRLARYAYQMFSGLAYLHYHKIVHRDWFSWDSGSLIPKNVRPRVTSVNCLSLSRAGHQSGELHANIAPWRSFWCGRKKIFWQYMFR